MSGLYPGLEIGGRSLLTQQLGPFFPDGRTNSPLFDPAYVTSDSIQISALATDNSQQGIVASRTTAGSDVDIALALGSEAERPVLPDGRTTLNGYYDSVVATIGMRSMEATNRSETQTLLVDQIASHRQSATNSSPNEELAQWIKAQHASEAAARTLANKDDAISTVIGGMGGSGR